MITRKRVLVIEDEFLVAAMLADTLEDAGAVPLGPAATLAEALLMAGTEVFDLAVVDWNLNGERSDAVARVLASRNIPYVISTGYGEIGAEFSGVPVLSKPYDPRELLKVMGGLIAAD